MAYADAFRAIMVACLAAACLVPLLKNVAPPQAPSADATMERLLNTPILKSATAPTARSIAQRTAQKIAACAALMAALSACTVGPGYRPEQPSAQAAYHEQEALAARTIATAAPALDSWWTGFDDPELVNIIRRVLAQNLDLSAAMARVAQARAAASEAGAKELPQVELDSSIARQRQSLDGPLGKIASALSGYEREQTLDSLDAGASWELDLFGGVRRGAEAAEAEAQAADLLQDGVRVSVAAEAADAYFRLRGQQARIALTHSQIDTDQNLLDLVRQRQTDGVATDLDLARAAALLAHARAALPPLQTELAQQSNRLDVLMGAAPGTYAAELSAAAADYVVPAIDSGDGPAQLLRRRPDVVAAERRLAASNARIGVAVAEYYPKISLSALLGFESLGSSTMFSAASFQPTAVAVYIGVCSSSAGSMRKWPRPKAPMPRPGRLSAVNAARDRGCRECHRPADAAGSAAQRAAG